MNTIPPPMLLDESHRSFIHSAPASVSGFDAEIAADKSRHAEVHEGKISIVVPCYNEADLIEASIERILGATRGLARSVELVFVDDGSADGTLDRLVEAQTKCPDANIIIVELSRNFGKEAAMTAGLDAASGDACVLLDADLQDPPELIAELISAWKSGFDVVAIRRRDRSSDTKFKRWTASWFYKINNLFADRPIPENVGDSRLIDRTVVDAIKKLPENRRFMKGLFEWVGFRTAYVDSNRLPRGSGQSKFSTWRLINFAFEAITSFSTSLLRLWTIFGLTISIYAFAHGAYRVARVLIYGVELPGYESLIVVILFLGGVQMIGFGLLGEYIGRIYHEAKRRPVYIVRRKHESIRE